MCSIHMISSLLIKLKLLLHPFYFAPILLHSTSYVNNLQFLIQYVIINWIMKNHKKKQEDKKHNEKIFKTHKGN
mgnify:CR=1 FL=1